MIHTKTDKSNWMYPRIWFSVGDHCRYLCVFEINHCKVSIQRIEFQKMGKGGKWTKQGRWNHYDENHHLSKCSRYPSILVWIKRNIYEFLTFE